MHFEIVQHQILKLNDRFPHGSRSVSKKYNRPRIHPNWHCVAWRRASILFPITANQMTKFKANWLCNALGGDRQKAPDTPKGGEFRDGSWVKDLLGDCNDIFEQGTRRKSRCAGNLCIVNSPGWLCPNTWSKLPLNSTCFGSMFKELSSSPDLGGDSAAVAGRHSMSPNCFSHNSRRNVPGEKWVSIPCTSKQVRQIQACEKQLISACETPDFLVAVPAIRATPSL